MLGAAGATTWVTTMTTPASVTITAPAAAASLPSSDLCVTDTGFTVTRS